MEDEKQRNGRNFVRRPGWARYGVAIASVALGWLGREALTPGVGPTALPFIFFFPAVAIAAWFGGLWPGILAIALSAFAANWFFAAPTYAFTINSTYDALALAAFLLAAMLIVWAIQAMHLARGRLVNEIAERNRVETELTNARDLLATTVASIGDAVIITDEKGRVTFLNPEAERLTGWKSSEAKGQALPKVFQIVNEQTPHAAENPVETVFRTGKGAELANHSLLISKDGRQIPIDDSAAPIRHADGPLFGVVLVFRDVTAQRQAQEAATQLAAIVEHSGDAIFTKNLDGVIQSWNPSAERLFGYTAEEVVGKPVTVLFPPDRLNEEDYIIGSLRQGRPVERLETIRVAKGGRRIPVALSVSPLKNDQGEVVGASKIVHDISEIVAARDALTREKELLATTLASIGDAVVVTDAEGRITYVNSEAERLTKWSNADAAGQPLPNVFRIVNEETRAAVEDPVKKVLRLGRVVGLANHTVLLAKDGSETPIDDSAAPICRPGGPLSGVVLVFRDFTERKQADAALRKNEALLSAVLKQLPVGLGVMETTGHWIVSNALMDQFVPQGVLSLRHERLGRWRTYDPTGQIIPSEDWPSQRALRGEIVSPGLEMIFTDDDGQERWVRVSAAPLRNDSGQIIGATAVVQDIDQVKRAEQRLAQLAAIVEHSRDAVIGQTIDAIATSWNPGAEALFGYSAADMIGRSVREIVPPEYASEEDQILLRLRAGESTHCETVRVRKNGRRIPVSITYSPVRDAAGTIVGGATIARDITQQKEIEEKLRDAQKRLLLHAADLEATVAERTAKLQETVNDLQGFSYSIAHDMRAPLRAMGTFAQLLVEAIPSTNAPPETKMYCERIIIGAARLDNLINDALNYTKAALQEIRLQEVHLSKLMRGLLDTYPNLYAENTDIRIEGLLPIVLGNESLLTQCFSNLLGNAVKFVKPGVRPNVRVWSEDKDGFARIWVEDNGIGIPEHAQPRLFAMFQKLDTQYEGTGIGLAIVRKVVERMGGRVGVESQPDRGSRFWVELRVARKRENA
jgi:PAS domain S-box-containing protein